MKFRIILFSCFDAVFAARILLFFFFFLLFSVNPHINAGFENKGINNILMIITAFIYEHKKKIRVYVKMSGDSVRLR